MKRNAHWCLILLGILMLGACPPLSSQDSTHAQHRPRHDPSAVFKTHVPHLRSAVQRGGAAAPAPIQPAASATFSGDSYSRGPIITPTTTIPEAEEHIAVAPGMSSAYLAAVSDFSRCLIVLCFNTTKWVVSSDGGSSWKENFVPLDDNPIFPFLVTADGLSWFANSDPVVAIDRSGNVYLADLYLNLAPYDNSNGLYVSVAGIGTLIPGGNFLQQNTYPIAANPSPTTDVLEDKEWIAVDNSGSTCDGTVYVSWTHFVGANDMILLSGSTNRGVNWSAPIQLSSASQNGAVQGSQVAVGPDGAVYVAYEVFFDAGQRQHFLTKAACQNGALGPFSTPIAITPMFNELSFASTYRTNSLPALAVAPNGNVYVTYSDQPDATVGAEVEFIRSTDGGSTFSPPMVINDNSAGQQFFAAVTVDGGGIIHASWFDTRNSPTDASKYDVYATYSKDDGGTFATNTRVTPALVDASDAIFIGDYSGIAAAADTAHPVWTNGGFNNGSLQTTTLTLP